MIDEFVFELGKLSVDMWDRNVVFSREFMKRMVYVNFWGWRLLSDN